MTKDQLKNVEKLTADQTEYTPMQKEAMEYMKEYWTGIGMDATNPEKDEVLSILNEFRKVVVGCEEAPVMIFNNPLETWDAVCLLMEDDKWGDVTEDEIRAEIQRRDDENITFRVTPRGSPHMFGSLDAGSTGFYSFFVDVLGVEVEDSTRAKLKAWKKTTKIGMFYLLDKMSCVSKKPLSLDLSNGELHSEKKPAILFEGDVGYYSLNGVPVPKELALTPSEELDINFFKNEKNADVKAEFVRKFGIERMLEFGKKIDTYENYDQEEQPWWWKSEYELWDMESIFDGLDYQPYLKMINQTTGIWHMEALSPTCRTIEDALKERFGGRDMRIVNIA